MTTGCSPSLANQDNKIIKNNKISSTTSDSSSVRCDLMGASETMGVTTAAAAPKATTPCAVSSALPHQRDNSSRKRERNNSMDHHSVVSTDDSVSSKEEKQKQQSTATTATGTTTLAIEASNPFPAMERPNTSHNNIDILTAACFRVSENQIPGAAAPSTSLGAAAAATKIMMNNREYNAKKKKQSTAQPRPPVLVPFLGIGPIVTPNTNDVLSGRGGRVNGHSGNVQFRRILADHKDEYLCQSTKKLDKAFVAYSVVEFIRRDLKPAGRFLKEDKNGLWWDIGDARATRKVGQALREG